MPDRPPAFFIANSLGLDFLNSIATPVDQPMDWLDRGEGLVAWLAQAKLVPTQALNALTKQATLGELDKVADQARVLREWFRGFVRTHMGGRLRQTRSATSRRSTRFSSVTKCSVEWRCIRTPTAIIWNCNRRGAGDRQNGLLLPIGETLARCVCDEDFANIRSCEGQRCTLIFADHTEEGGQTLVQHGDVRQSRQADRPSSSPQG